MLLGIAPHPLENRRTPAGVFVYIFRNLSSMLRNYKRHLSFINSVQNPIHNDCHQIRHYYAIDEAVDILEHHQASQQDRRRIQHKSNNPKRHMGLHLLDRHTDKILSSRRRPPHEHNRISSAA